MNKSIALTIVAVILLGMGLVLFNEYTSQPPMPLLAGTTPPAPIQSAPPKVAPEISPEKPDSLGTHSVTPAPTPHVTQATTPPAVHNDANTHLPAPFAPSTSPVAQNTHTTLAPPPLATAPSDITTTTPEPAPSPVKSPSPLHNTDGTTHATSAETNLKNQEDEQESTLLSAPTPTQNIAKEQSPPEEVPVLIAEEVITNTEPETTPPLAQTPPQPELTPVQTPPQEEPKVSSTATNRIEDISILSIGNGVTVRLKCTKLPIFGHMLLTSPDRVVLDLNGTWDVKTPTIKENEFVYNIRVGQQKRGTRIVIDLRKAPKDVRYLKYEQTDLDVRIR